MIGLSTGIISNYRNGKTEPKLSAIVSIANYLNVDCHYLLTGVSSKNSTVSEETGLSEASINYLTNVQKQVGPNSSQIEVLNDLIESNDIQNLLLLIAEFKKTQKLNEETISLCRDIIEEVRAGIEKNISPDILQSRLAIPLCRLEEIRPSEEYGRFLIIDRFTKLFDAVYTPTDFSKSDNLLEDSFSLGVTLRNMLQAQ